MRRSPFSVTRRAFLQAAAAGVVRPAGLFARRPPDRETLYNGIVLADPWPPNRLELPVGPERPPYLADPPPVINIDVGRQLFVDDFLIEQSSLHRAFHGATYHSGNPVLTPVRDWERLDPYAENTGVAPSPSAMVFSDGVFFDPADRQFKMWYMGGYQQGTALALSRDGFAWERHDFDVVPGTNLVSSQRRDSNTVWLDLSERDPSARFKMAGYDMGAHRLRLHQSADGVHWRQVGITGPCGDRSTCFRNPFRDVWVFSLRADNELTRYRRYAESRGFASATWADGGPVVWTGGDDHDLERPGYSIRPQVYNLDAVAYESVLLGLFTIYRGEQVDREKPNDICLGFSRDGFHWSRLWREPFIPVSEHQGDWNWCNVQSAGGGCLVVGDRLHFYVSGRQGVPGTGLPGVCSTGLATLRRDGFASVGDQWPAGVPRRVTSGGATLTTRPLRFSGRHLFVNAEIDGELRVEVLDAAGRAIEGYAGGRSMPVTGDGTRLPVRWQGHPSLDGLSGQVVRFRFTLSRARLYAFWVSATPAGHSRGYVAAGGPGFTRPDDVE